MAKSTGTVEISQDLEKQMLMAIALDETGALGKGDAVLTSYERMGLMATATVDAIFTEIVAVSASATQRKEYITKVRGDVVNDGVNGATASVRLDYVKKSTVGATPSVAQTGYALRASAKSLKLEGAGVAAEPKKSTNLQFQTLKDGAQIASVNVDTSKMVSAGGFEWPLVNPDMIASELGVMSYQEVRSEEVEPAAMARKATYTINPKQAVNPNALEELPLTIPEISVGIALLGIIDALLNTNDEDTIKAAFLILALNVIKLDQTME